MDTTTAQPGQACSAARIYTDLLGGTDSTAADRDVARELAARHPVLRVLTLQNRRYLERAVHQLASGGISRFLDLGCGAPITFPDGTHLPMVHEVARDAGADPRVLYVDSDPAAALHMAAETAGNGNITVVKGDLADPDSGLIGEHLRELTADGKPAAAIFAAVLQYWNAAVAQEIVAWYAEALPPRSAVVITTADLSEEGAADRRARLPEIPFHNHTERAVESFFGAAWLKLDGPVADVAPVCVAGRPKADRMLGAVGRKL